MKKITLLLALLMVSVGFGQTILEDFEGETPELATIAGTVSTIAENPTISAEKSMKIVTSAGEKWQASKLMMQNNKIDMRTTDKTLSVKIWADAARDFLVKLTNGDGGGTTTDSKTYVTHTGSGWETLTADFNIFADSNQGTFVANDQYSSIEFYPLYKHNSANTTGGWNAIPDPAYISYIDDITAIAGDVIIPPSQNITVSVDISEGNAGGVNIVTPTVTGGWAEYAATVDPNNANKFSYTFADGVESAEYVWKIYYTAGGANQENLLPLVQGGGIDNNIAGYLDDKNPMNTDFGAYCNRTAKSTTGIYVAPTFYYNSFREVGKTYTELVLTAATGGSYAIDYSINDFNEFHGPGATDNEDGTYTVIVDPTKPFEYLWYDLTAGTREDLLACDNGNGINTDNSGYANRTHAAGKDEADTFGACPPVNTNTECTGFTSEALEGTFSNGINYSFVTSGTDVNLTFEILDTDKEGLNPQIFIEPSDFINMNSSNAPTYTATLVGQTPGADISFSLRAAYAGGLVRSKIFTYTVGEDCATASIDKNNLLEISLYPNPAKGKLNISAKNIIESATIYNILGKKVKSFTVNAKTSSLDVSVLSRGIYILKYTANNTVGSMKFIKE
jgi:hypothetical protein